MGLRVTDLAKRYGRTTALDGMSLDLRPGVVYGLFGRNGAGKSTLLGCLGNRLIPDSGSLELDGEPLAENEPAMERTYLADERLPWWPGRSLESILRDCGRIYGGFDREFADTLAERFGIDVECPYNRLSLGRRTASRMAIGLCLPVDYLFLDEPTLGLDPVARTLMARSVIEACARRSRTVVISTHDVAEFAGVIEAAVVIDHGRRLDRFDVQDLYRHAAVLSGPASAVDAAVGRLGLTVLDRECHGMSANVMVALDSGADVWEGVPDGTDDGADDGSDVGCDDPAAALAARVGGGVHVRTPDLRTYVIRLIQERN
ncbi:ABC transporter ATP-binding protein [Bifidobacterium phasiani]|uniref:ABC transporter ATP-binding protein n=1 Tax=Bifidobacterium phasiani TaxID=2834431 RepID=A0ABS6WBJ0_9BIFI|nr:ABC transporter ATP-binding protein [Bifidobacterium phasiani]MBW3083116.1 ABC transporter ATP-binding protein [Bifidobacterium phasiani]